MAKDTKKTKTKTQIDFSSELSTWRGFIDWLRDTTDEEAVKACMLFEIQSQNRPMFIDRARTRFNKLRALRELKELEKLSGKVISVNFL